MVCSGHGEHALCRGVLPEFLSPQGLARPRGGLGTCMRVRVSNVVAQALTLVILGTKTSRWP